MTTQIPGPPAWQTVWQFTRDPLQMFSDARVTWGDVVCFSALGYAFYQVTSPTLAHDVLTHDDLQMSVMMEHPFVGQGLANNIGDSWKRQRRLLQPHFHQKAVQHFADQMVQATHALSEQWAAQDQHDVLPGLVRLNHQILGATVLDLDFNQHPQMLAALRTIRRYLNRRFQAIITVPEAIPTPRNRAFKRAVALWDQAVNERIALAGDEPTLLAMLRHAEDPKTGYRMTDAQLRDEVNTIFFNGYEDPGATVTWALYLLSQHPQVQSALYQQIHDVLGDRQATVADLRSLPLLDNVIKETMRLYPTTWAVIRDARGAVPLGDYVIPDGASVQVTIFLIHRHPDYWEQADSFDPSRFDRAYPSQAYMPYGAGPRQCIGRAFADMQMRLILVTLLQRYRFDFVPQDVQINAMASLRPNDGLRLRLYPRSDR